MGTAKVKRSAFRRWIEKTGVSEVARQLGVHRRTVYNWKTGHCYPLVHQMRDIKAITKGKISYEHIIDGLAR